MGESVNDFVNESVNESGSEPERGVLTPKRAEDATGDAAIGRLERAVHGLLGRFATLRDENEELKRRAESGEGRIAELEAEVRHLNQTRRDVAKRIDDLIAQIDQLEGRFHARGD